MIPCQFEKLWQIDEEGEEDDGADVDGKLLSLVRNGPDHLRLSADDRVPLVDDGHRHVDGGGEGD